MPAFIFGVGLWLMFFIFIQYPCINKEREYEKQVKIEQLNNKKKHIQECNNVPKQCAKENVPRLQCKALIKIFGCEDVVRLP